MILELSAGVTQWSTTGLIFDLKNNYGWTDKVDVDQKQETVIRIDKIFEKA